MTEENNVTKQLLTVNFNSNDNYLKAKDKLSTVLKELLRGLDFNSVNIFCNDETSTITAVHSLEVKTDDLFEMDVTPCPVPIAYVQYESVKSLSFEGSIDIEKDVMSMPKNTCFNCGSEDHELRKCPEPRDAKRISRARQNMAKKYERYHLNVDQKYDAYKPGVLSDELTNALGLKPKELPLHIYHMRIFGYPPGWLEEAKSSGSGLTMFNHHNTESPEENEESFYDADEIIEYPGFNVPVGNDFIDDCRKYGLPRMQPKHEKDYFISNLKTRTKEVNEPEDMDLESGEENDNDRSASPTLIELREAQKKIVEQLNSENIVENDDGEEGEILDGYTILDETIGENSIHSSECSIMTRSNALSIVEGTPILESFSPYSKLPKGENWSVGVSDVINFENLPDSTGKYEQMKGVLSKVRKCLNK